MSRFVEVNGVYINADSIKYYYQDTHNRLHVEFADGTEKDFCPLNVEYTMARLSGRNHIAQVIPVTEPVYAVYKDEQPNRYFTRPIYYLVLCADGEISGVEYSEGWFDFVEEGNPNNCVGLYHKDQLEQFPGAIDSITP